MSTGLLLSGVGLFALIVIGVAMALVVIRLILGPTLADRILALDTLSTLGIGFICAFALTTRLWLALDITVALALTGFLSTAALSRYLLKRGQSKGEP